MAEETVTSSWHPALMPNFLQDPPTDEVLATSQSVFVEEVPEPSAHASEIQDSPHAQDIGETGDGDAWFPDETLNANGLGDAEPAAEELETSRYALADSEHEAIETGHEASASDPPAHKHAARHSSSLSFARTVSHEVSFNDDDDTEWSLSQTNSDPFKSMAQPDRTNSFPVVPLMPVDTEHQDEVPLQPNQAMVVLEEAERDFDAEEEQYQCGYQQETQADEPEGPNSSGHGHAHSRSIGGDVPLFEIETLEARFEEGLPLISHASDRPNGQGDDAKGGFASFDDEDVDNDEGFFSQIHAAETEDSDDMTRQSLQRKSTMQVLASIDSASPSQQARWEGISEDEDEEERAESAEERTDLDVGDKPNEAGAAIKDDLASKWQEAFASENDDADFLLGDAANENKDVDAAAFLGSDDEGLLDDDDDDDDDIEPAPASQPTTAPHSRPPSGSQHVTHSYFPSQQHTLAHPSIVSQPPNPYSAVGQLPHRGPPPQYGQPPVPQLEVSKAESFADKSRGGYSSPYDLPTDLIATTVKPRKRASMQQLPREPAAQSSPLLRSASMNAPAPPPSSAAAPSAHHKPPVPAPAPAARAHESFFEDLPMTTKLRPGSRQTNRAPSPGVFVPPGPSPLSTPMTTHPPHVAAAAPTSAPVPDLVGPEKVNPYATLQTQLPPALPPTGSASRYSPAPTQLATGPPVVTTRYSPAPPASRPPSSYNPAIPAAAVQPAHAHLPRTSSPLAHFEMNSGKTHVAGHDLNGDAAHPHELRATRVPSLPTTREVDEEEDLTASSRKESLTRSPPAPPTISRYSPVPTGARRTPPPPVASGQSMLSPPQRPGSSYVSHAPPPAQPGFAPPPRAQTQSPGASRGGRHASKSSDPGRLPASSSQASASPAAARSATATHAHPRPPLPTANMVAPTDGREHDPLQRWQGVPIVCWGVGGSMVTSFPKSIPRYVMNQTTPSMLRAAGEVKVRNIKDIEPLPERVARFPGPLKGKSKKKEVLAWLSAGIESLEKELPGTTAFQYPATTTEEAKRAVERLLLWKVLHVLIEFDGVLEGTPAVEKAVRDILSPGTAEDVASQDGGITFGVGAQPATATSMQPDGVDAGAMEQIRRDLLRGDHETAVWAAVDKRLWGHAMLISRTVSPELYKRVAQEFVRKEVNHAGHSNESLAALYKILSGNYDDCVDELVPVHARAGLQLVSTESSLGPARTAGDGLEKWRETLTLVLSNRSADDVRGLNALGKLLSGYGRAEAAHICFIFSRSISVFGGLDDPNVDYVLLGSDHRRSALHLAQDTEALQLTEVYEYGLSLSGAAAGGSPHLTAYKLHHVITLAEYGHRDKALQYCDAISTAMSSQTRRSPYHHSVLEATVMDVMRRLKQAPKEESASWMSKPSMNKVSDSMWNRFNKFVAGDEQEGDGTAGEGENGPFARIATPTMSRSPSVSNLESFGMTSPSYPTPSSRYAPQASRNSSEYHSNPYEPAYPGVGSPTSSGGYVPAGVGSPSSSGGGYVPVGVGVGSSFGYQSLDAGVNLGIGSGVPPMALVQQDTSQVQPDPPSYGIGARETHAVSDHGEVNQKEEKEGFGYEPPPLQPYGYEPPSYEPEEPLDADGDVAAAPKKKSFMDDDDDDIPGLKPQEKSKAEKDRENEEMFRKAAEEDAKRAAASSAKKGWGFGWFGGNSKKETAEQAAGKPIKAKLGEASSFVYDPDLRRWINKKPGAENVEVKAATPPPPRGGAARGDAPRSVSGTPPGRDFTPPPPPGRASVPPLMNSGLLSPPALKRATSQEAFQEGNHEGSLERLAGPPAMTRSVSASTNGPASRPPSRPTTSVSNASSIDDLLSTGPRKGGQKKRKGGRYVDVMAK